MRIQYTFWKLVIFAFFFPSNITTAVDILKTGSELKMVASGFAFTEGPAVDLNGDVYFTDQPNDRILKWRSDNNTVSDWLKPAGRSNGMYFDQNGNLLTCADEQNQIWSISPNKKISVLIKDFEGKLFNGPNDLWIHSSGRIYFTDPLYKRPYWKRDPKMQLDGRHVYLLDPMDNSVTKVDSNLIQPNGIVGSPDGKFLYVADINAGKTYKYRITPSGELTNRELFCRQGSDGMALDQQGNLYLTGKGVTVFNSKGEKIHHIPVPEKWTANVVFGGKNFDQLFITAMDSVYTLQMNVKGARQNKKFSRIQKKFFGELEDGHEVFQYTLKNKDDIEVKIINYGAIMTSIMVPDRSGLFQNVIVGSDSLKDYLKSFPSAAIIGRFANRIKNATFSIDGRKYHITKNNGQNHIHGGKVGFSKKLWKVVGTQIEDSSSSLILECYSKDGEEGFPGNLTTRVTYSLDDTNTLKIDYHAKTDAPTIVNLTNHAYFNLSGSTDVHPNDHTLWLHSETVTEVDKSLIPTGEILEIKGTPLDFLKPKLIGQDVGKMTQFRRPMYDNNFIICHDLDGWTTFARVEESKSGRYMEVATDQPGVQLFTGNPKGLCLETQHYPDSINHSHFPSPVLRPGKPFQTSTSFTFGWK